jgi:alpha-L-fucosidase
MNVGPKADGSLPKEAVKILEEIGAWKLRNQEAIHGVKETPFKCGFSWGSVSRSIDEKNMYIYLTSKVDKICLSGINGSIKKISEIGGVEQSYTFENGNLTIRVKTKQQVVPVIKVEFFEKPTFSKENIAHGNTLTLKPIYADKYVVEGDAHKKVELVFLHNIYDPMWGKRGLSIERNDTVTHWSSETEYLSWQVEINESGEYECLMVVGKMGGEAHSLVEIQGRKIDARIKEGEEIEKCNLSRTGEDNIRRIFSLGKVNVEKGKAEVFLKRIGDGHNIAVSELKFVKQ